MKNLLLIILFIVCTNNCFSQILYEKGYFIDNSGQKTECYIKNVDWQSNPTAIQYKIVENELSKTLKIESVQEFGIDNFSKYIRCTVLIDRSSNSLTKLSEIKNPIFEEEELFLQVLVESQASLYEYIDGNLHRYFYRILNGEVQQLVFKYYKNEDNEVGRNYRFKQQLYTDLVCPKFTIITFDRLHYIRKDLVKLFETYNKCGNHEYINFVEKQKKDLFNLSIRPRYNYASLEIVNSVNSFYDSDWGGATSYGIGLEFEYIFPFNKNKWSLILEPTYQQYSAETSREVVSLVGKELNSRIDYSSIEIPFGMRYYLYVNKRSKLFVNASIVLDFDRESSIVFTRKDGSTIRELDIDTRGNFAAGLGYNYNDKFSLELRYQGKRDVLKKYNSWTANYTSYSFIIGYTLL